MACWANRTTVEDRMATGTSTQTSPATDIPPPKAKESRGWLWSLLVGLLILGLIATVPIVGDASDVHTWTLIVMFAVLAQSWNFIGGFAGYSAFGNVAFFGIGAYTTGLLLLSGYPFWLGLVAGALVAGLFAFLLGLPRMNMHVVSRRRSWMRVRFRAGESALWLPARHVTTRCRITMVRSGRTTIH